MVTEERERERFIDSEVEMKVRWKMEKNKSKEIKRIKENEREINKRIRC